MKEYEVTIDSITHTMLLDEDDAKLYKTAKLVKAKRTPPAPPAPPAVEQPADDASVEDWSKYAVEVKGAKPADLVGSDKKTALTVEELKAKFGTNPA